MIYDVSGVDPEFVLGLRHKEILYPVYYTRKALNHAQKNYTMIEKEVLAVVFVFEEFLSYLIRTKVIMHTNHTSLRYLIVKKYVMPSLI